MFPFDVKAIGSAITKTKITTPRIIDDAITMGLNHLDWKIDVLLALLLMFKKERYIFHNATTTGNLFTYFDGIVVLDCFHSCLMGLDMLVVCLMMDLVRNQ